jgi:hypothetical protein
MNAYDHRRIAVVSVCVTLQPILKRRARTLYGSSLGLGLTGLQVVGHHLGLYV